MEMRCAMVVSAASSTCESFSVGELSARYKIGWSAGFTLRKEGGVGMLGGKLAASLRDGRLHIERGAIETAAQIELDGDAGLAEGVRRGHRVDAGDGGELFFERRGDRRGHRLRARAGQRGVHLDGGKVHVRQIADGQEAIGEDAEDEDRRHDQRGHDRTFNEELRNAHCPPPAVPVAASLELMPLPTTAFGWQRALYGHFAIGRHAELAVDDDRVA